MMQSPEQFLSLPPLPPPPIQNKKMPFWASIWFWWLLLTIVYLPFSFFLLFATPEPLPLVGVIGLFVPFGIWNGQAALSAFGLALTSPQELGVGILRWSSSLIGPIFLFLLVFVNDIDKKL